MARKNLRLISLFLCLVFCFNFCLPVGIAQAEILPQDSILTDTEGHWAEREIKAWLMRDLAGGYPDGTFRPDHDLTRAEFVVLVNRAFGYSQTTALNFTDVLAEDWYASDIAIAKANGYISGYPEGTFKPNQPISRQEIATILTKILSLNGITSDFLAEYRDFHEIPFWSLSAIQAITENGYMGGYPDGTFQPAKALTRAEAISVLDRAVGLLYNRSGTFGPLLTTTMVEGNVTITARDVTLKNMVITGSLYLTEGVEAGELTFDNVQVQGTTKISGGTKINLTPKAKLNTLLVDAPVAITGKGTIDTACINTSGVTIETKPTKLKVADDVTDFKTTSSGSKKKSKKTRTDRTAPTFAVDYPRTANIRTTQLDLLVQINESGKAYYLLLPAGAEKPSPIQIKEGRDAGDKKVAENCSGQIKLTANEEASVTLNRLQSSTTYDLYVVAEDNNSNLQSVVTKLKVTTKTPKKSSEATLSDLTLDGETITNFDPEETSYTIELTEIPTVAATATNFKATVNITQATELPGVATVVVTAEDGTTKIYTINFTLASVEEPTIVKINDLTAVVKVGETYTLPETVIALLSDDTTRELPVTWEPSSADTDKEGEYTFIGTVENYDTKVILTLQVIAEEITTYTVEVIANPSEGGTVTGDGEYPAGASVTVSATANKGYTFINWTEKEAEISTDAVYAFSMRAEAVCLTANFGELSSEATLSDLTLDGETITNFDSEKTAYTIELAEIPKVAATATNSKATVNITQATELPGVATVVVTAEDGTMKTYTINFEQKINLVTKITVTGATTVEEGKTLQMIADIEPADATDKTVAWSAEDGTGEASIDDAGLLMGVAKGTVTVKATANDGSDVVGILEVTVVAPAPVTYTVTFDSNGGETEANPQTMEVNYGETVDTLPIPPDKVGHTFAGWNTQADGNGTAITETTSVTADLTVYAQWTINQYTLAYTAGDNGSITGETPQTVNYGESGTTVTAVPDTGYHFVGWSDGVTDNPRTDTNVTANVSVTASFAINTYTVTFKDHDGAELKTETVEYGNAATAPEVPTREGYTFTSWDTDFTNVTGDLIVTAQYSINIYTVTFNSNGGDTEANPQTKTATYGGNVGTLPTAPTKTGHTFAGWNTQADGNGTTFTETTLVTGNITVYAQWTINTYTLTYTAGANGSISGDTPQTVNYGESGTEVTAVPDTGYHFVDWSDGSTKNPRTDTNVTANVSVTASFAINTYTVTFKDHDGAELKTETVEHGNAATAPANPTRDGHTFTSWDTDFTNVTGDLIVTAQYSINTYTVTFNNNGGETEANPQTMEVNYGETITAPEEPTKTGYTFVGWFKDEGLENVWNFATDTVTEATTLYAKWTINQYTITFNSNGGSTVESITLDYGASVTAPQEPTKEGYTFAGWDKEIPATMPAEDITITAKWETVEYTITYNLDGGVNDANNPTSYNIEMEDITLANATKVGYTFGGWWDAASEGSQVTSIPKGSTGDKTLYARWTPNSDTAYKVEHYQQNVTDEGYTLKDTDNLTGTTDASVTASAKSYLGFTENKEHAQRVASGTITPDGSLVLKLYYDRNTFTVSFNSNGGSAVDNITGVRYEATIDEPTAPTKTGYTFAGWFKEAELTNAWNFATDTVTEATTLYAKWTTNTYTLTYTAGANGSISGDTPQTVNHGADGTTVTAVPDMGYHFVGWSDGITDNPRMDTNVTANVSVTASFAINTYTVTFKDHDGTILDTQTVEHNSAATAPEVPIREGYTFTSWDKAFTNVTSDLIVTAQYSINTYTVTFNNNGGDTEPDPQTKTATYGGNVGTLPTAPTKTGHTFASWNTQADGGGTAFTETTLVTADITVYAQWVVNVTEVSLNKTETTLAVGTSETLTATVTPDNASNKDVTWSSDNETIATVDATGTVTAVAAGTATITVTTADGGKTATCVVTVVVSVTSITVMGANEATTVEKDKTLQMSVAIEPADATDNSVTWSVEAGTGSALISETGLLTGVAKGTVIVKAIAKDGFGAEGMLEVTVVEPVGAAWTVGTKTTMDRLNADAETDFDSLYPWSEMKLCNVADDGTINAYIGDTGFKRDGTNGQVMVKIPKFYYKHTYDGVKHEFWVADAPIEDFKLHPCFVRVGVEKDYVLMGAYKAGEEVVGETTKLTSISGALPAVSRTRATFRTHAQNRGTNWYIVDALARNAVALLYLVEFADTNCQTAIGKGITELRYHDADTITEATTEANTIIVFSTTGGYFKVGQVVDVGTSRGTRNICRDRKITGIATEGDKTTITVDGAPFTTAVGNILYHVGQRTGGCDDLDGASGIAPFGTDGETGVSGRVSVSYRGLEDLWGNVWEFIEGINIKNDEQQPYIADSNFVDDTFTGDYQASGAILPSGNGYMKDFACSEAADWLLMPGGDTKAKADVAVGGSASTYIPDYYYQDWPRYDYADKVALAGGHWASGSYAGLFDWYVDGSSADAWVALGARPLQIP